MMSLVENAYAYGPSIISTLFRLLSFIFLRVVGFFFLLLLQNLTSCYRYLFASSQKPWLGCIPCTCRHGYIQPCFRALSKYGWLKYGRSKYGRPKNRRSKYGRSK